MKCEAKNAAQKSKPAHLLALLTIGHLFVGRNPLGLLFRAL